MTDLKPIRVYRGGLIWGRGYFRRFFVSFPIAKLTVGKDVLTLSALRTEFRFERNEIIGIEVKFGFLAKGLRFIHRNAEYPPQIKFLTFQSEEILSVLDDVPLIP